MSNYIVKDELNQALIDYQAQCAEAEEQGKPIPAPSDYIGKAIMQIAYGLANRYNFRNYTWKEEMIGDGIVAACSAIRKYNPYAETKSGSPNPYGFFTQTIFWSYQNRIVAEKKQSEIKMAYLREVTTQLHIDGIDGVTHTIDKEGMLQFLDADRKGEDG